MSSAGTKQGPHQSAPDRFEAFARQLLAAEAGEQTTPEAFATAGERVYHRLRERLAVLLGAAGFDALWARAMHLAQPEFRPGDTAVGKQPFPTDSSHADGVHAAVRGRYSAAVQHTLVVVFASFVSLLFTFIGEELGLHFMYQLWPDLRPDLVDSPTDGARS